MPQESDTTNLQQEADTIMRDEKRRPGFFRSFFREVWEFAKIVLISLAIVLPVRLFIAQPFIVRGASMVPNFEDGQYLIIDELSYLLRNPQRGEVIVFRYPQDPSQFFIKRIIGLPGETVSIQQGTVTIITAADTDGFELDEAYLPPHLVTAPNSRITLEGSEYFVMGDNRLESSDSRRWGALEKEFLIGRAFLRLWPVNELGLVTNKK